MAWQEITTYPKISLQHILSKSEEWIEPDPDITYRLLTVRMWGQGIVERGLVKGSEISAKKMLVVRPQQFIISRIDARHGASGVISSDCDGSIVTNEFPVFNTNPAKLLPQYLGWLSKTPDFIDLCKVASEGTTNRVRLKEDKFLNLEIPLPSIEEQRRIVARIEKLATSIAEARGLRKQSLDEISYLRQNYSQTIFKQYPKSPLNTLSQRITKGESPSWQGFSYQESGVLFIRSENVLWGKLDLSSKTYIPLDFHQKLSRSQLTNGDVLINLVGASIGRACVVVEEFEDANINQAVAVISPDYSKINSHYLMYFLLSRNAQNIIHEGKVETARPNISLNDLRKLPIPVPSVEEQHHIVVYLDDLQDKIDALKHLQTETAAELDALLPSILDKAFKGEL